MNTAETYQEDTHDGLNAIETDTAIVLAELQRVMQNRRFSGAPQMSSFLKYIVEQTLSGNSNRIKAYSIGVDALGKPESFDAQTDPSVRVLALRLRKALAELYQSDDKPLAIIVLKVGSYTPEFYQVERAAEPEQPAFDDRADRSTTNIEAISPFTMVGERHPSRDDVLNSDSASTVFDSLVKYRHPGVILAVLTAAAWLWGSSTQATGISAKLSQILTGPVVPSLHIEAKTTQSEGVKEVAALMTTSLVLSKKFNILSSRQSISSSVTHNNLTYRMVFAEFVIDGLPRIDAQIVHENSGVIIFSRPLLFDTNMSEFSLSEMSDISRLAANISAVPGPVYDDFCQNLLHTESCDF